MNQPASSTLSLRLAAANMIFRKLCAKEESTCSSVMAEHIPMPWIPELTVTREYAYEWLRGCGWDPEENGIGSMDFEVFGPNQTELPLTDLETAARSLSAVRHLYKRSQVNSEHTPVPCRKREVAVL